MKVDFYRMWKICVGMFVNMVPCLAKTNTADGTVDHVDDADFADHVPGIALASIL